MKIKDAIPDLWSKEMLRPIGHELTLVREYKTLNEWFKDLCLDDKLSLYHIKIQLDSQHYVHISPIVKKEVKKKK